MKRILCLIDSLGPGGAQRQLVGLASMLYESKYEVCVVTYHNDSFFKPVLSEKGIVHSEIGEGLSSLRRILEVRKIVKKFQPDCVISYQETPSLIACLIRLSGLKFKLLVSERSTTQVITKKDKVRFALYKIADYIVPNSYSQSDFLKMNYKWMIPKMRTIINCVDTNHFSPLPQPADSHSLRFVTASSVSKNKNVLAFVEAVNLVAKKGARDYSIKWYGEVEESKTLCEECRELIRKYNLDDIFEILPKTNNILEEYRKADVFFFPTLYEGTPNALCEAMSCGLFILSSDVCDNPRYVQDGKNGVLFDPKSVNSMSDALVKTLEMPVEEIREYGKRSREIAMKEFSKETFINQYIKLIEE